MECGYPPRNNQPIAGHPSEWMIMRDMLSAGIAIYDEYPDMYNHVITMLYRDYIPARNYFYEGQNYHQARIMYMSVLPATSFLCGFWIRWEPVAFTALRRDLCFTTLSTVGVPTEC